MAVADPTDLRSYCLDLAQRAQAASAELARTSGSQKSAWLRRSAELLRERTEELAAANAQDLAAADGYGLTAAAIDRLRLTPKVVESIAAALEQIAAMPEPIGEIIESTIRPNVL